jgi:hypothetical protein
MEKGKNEGEDAGKMGGKEERRRTAVVLPTNNHG